MARLVGTLAFALSGVSAADPAWKVLNKAFSAVTIGISFQNDQVGWTSHTDGSSLPVIVRTADGGKTWAKVNSTKGVSVLNMGVAAVKGGITDVATTGALESSVWSLDGENFVQSLGAPLVSQDIKFQAGRMVIAEPKGVCFSSTGGALYTCKAAPLKNPGTGRYASSPSKDVVFLTAGTWPSKSSTVSLRAGGERVFHLTRNVRAVHAAAGSATLELGPEEPRAPVNGTYTAELWKSSDGGATWKNLIADEGNFYFNDIHCIDEQHCVAVGEGFADDGSKAPGARVYVTTDGETFNLVHSESATASLMAAKMISTTEHWVGGTTKVGGFLAPTLLLHSRDAGKSYTNEHNNIMGQMITSFDTVSPTHAYATSISALQICALLEYGGAAVDTVVV